MPSTATSVKRVAGRERESKRASEREREREREENASEREVNAINRKRVVVQQLTGV